MSEEYIVEISGISKRFELRRKKGFAGISFHRFDAVNDLLRGRIRRRKRKKDRGHLWALKDININVRKGEIVGIIGRNGAGKSTLLKILARIYRPTKGTAIVRGGMASLLEMGMGFDRDMSVRENIILNGVMNNISEHDTEKVIKQVASFANLEQHLDTSLQHCPSGSYIKLAFSTAINMNADVILADEVLAVGDMSFQSECINHIKHLSTQGQSVLFVSHDMAVIRDLCNRVIWIDKGEIIAQGDPEDVTEQYEISLLGCKKKTTARPAQPNKSTLNIEGGIRHIRFLSADQEQIGAINMGAPAIVEFLVHVGSEVEEFTVHTACYQDGHSVFSLSQPRKKVDPGKEYYHARLHLPPHFLNELSYEFKGQLELHSEGQSVVVEQEQSADVSVYNTDGKNSAWGDWPWGRPGFITPLLNWTYQLPKN